MHTPIYGSHHIPPPSPKKKSFFFSWLHQHILKKIRLIYPPPTIYGALRYEWSEKQKSGLSFYYKKNR